MKDTSKARPRHVHSYMEDGKTGKQMKIEKTIEISPREVDARSFVAELARSHAGQIDYYTRFGLDTPEDAREKAAASRERDREKIKDIPAREIGWWQLSAVAENDLNAAFELWEKIKAEARDWIESGRHFADTLCEQTSPFQRAQIFALREQMAEGWNPQNGIERALIDMLTNSYLLHLHWTSIAHEWATRTAEKLEKSKQQSPYRNEQYWKRLYISEGECVDRAHRLADGYHRQFMRALRQLRDLRRYALPVIVNNGGQVNVATEHGQQVNMAGSRFGDPFSDSTL